MRTAKLTAIMSLCVLVLVAPAWAQQEGRGGRPQRAPRMQQLPLAQAETAWTWQARSVARDLKLDEDVTGRLVDVYVAARKTLRKKLADLREANEGGERGRRWRIDPELIEAQREALQSQVSKILPEAQADRAMPVLGAFRGQWDRMVDAVAGMRLGEAKTYAALAPILQYEYRIIDIRTMDDRQAMRGAITEAREGLLADLGKVLSEEQLASFRDATGRRGPARGGPRGEQPAPERAAKAAIGKPAPAFELKDEKDQSYVLADYRGKIVVLQWINPGCPVCRRTFSAGKVAAMRKQLEALSDDIVHLTINSTYTAEPAASAAYLKSYQIDAPALSDRDGTVGHLYGAEHTPHMFVIDAEGILRYQGAFDDDERNEKGDAATNYVVQAVKQILAGETVSPDRTRAYGCTVKYAPGK
jgi:peroxiredoxin